MTNEERKLMEEMETSGEAFKGCLFLFIIISAALTTIITIIIIN